MDGEFTALVTPEQARRARRAGTAQGECSRMQKHQVQARRNSPVQVTKQRISQEVGGDHTATAAKWCDLIWEYSVHRRTDPAPLLLEPLLLYREARAEQSARDVASSFNRKLGQQAEAQARAEVAIRRWYRGEASLPELLHALRRDTWLRISTIADGEYLAEHGIDPRET